MIENVGRRNAVLPRVYVYTCDRCGEGKLRLAHAGTVEDFWRWRNGVCEPRHACGCGGTSWRGPRRA